MAILKQYHDLLVFSVLFITPVLFFVLVMRKIWKKSPTNWPVIGMLPAILQNGHNIHEYFAELVKHKGTTFELKAPVFANMDMLITCDAANIKHILHTNFKNYPKGPRFRKIFQVLGDGIFSTDSETWELHKKTTVPLMNHSRFRTLLESNVSHKVENSLLPVLDYHAQLGVSFDLQEIFQKFSFDTNCQLFLDKDPGSLCICKDKGWAKRSDHPLRKAFKDGMDAIFYRHILPERFWKLQKWLVGVDRERKISEAEEAFDEFIIPILLERQEKLNKNEECSNFSMMTSHMKAHPGKSMKFLRDTLVTLTVAGADTLSSALTWLFWLLAKNPSVEAKILEEILQVRPNRDNVFKVEECRKLVYLHATLCESIRLFPPVPLNRKIPKETDILPSGHVVNPDKTIIIPIYAMGRMDAIWGEDCMEFKPERWISPSGGIRHQPSYKFPVFNAGPRTCIGKELYFIVAKMVAASIIYDYKCQIVEPHPLTLSFDSIFLQMKHGLKVKFSKRG